MYLNRIVLVVCLLMCTGSACAWPTSSLLSTEQYHGLTADHKAYKVGDSLTVVVLQSASAESQAGTGASNSQSLNFTAHDSIAQPRLGLGVDGSSKGQGVTSRQGAIRAALSVRVVAVSPDGSLGIKGQQTIVVNGEKQTIAVSGEVRPEDIGSNNTVLSSRLSDADIRFTGNGSVAGAQHHGLFYEFFRWLGLL